MNDAYTRSNIEFPDRLSVEDTEELFFYIAKFLPGDVRYTLTREVIIRHEGEDNIEEEYGTPKITANITSKNGNTFEFGDLESILDDDGVMISGFKFSLIPGYDIRDYEPSKIKLWDNVRKLVNKYFKEVYDNE